MNKYWQIPDSNDIVIIRNENIYFGTSELEFNESIEVPKHFDIISLGEVNKIENIENTNYIKIFFSKYSTTKLYLDNENIKSEIVKYINQNLTEFKYKKELPTNIEYAKGHYIIIVLLLFFFFCSLYFAIGISNGENFELRNMRVGILHFCLYIAQIGIINLIIVFTVLISFVLYLLWRKIRMKGIIETLMKKNN
ncbi:hypothetical protein [Lacinutrix sp. MEBiC02595]